jgi:hypothetical protein
MGAVADTVRAVAIEDQTFSEVAIARFGSRVQTWIEQEKTRGRSKKGTKLAFVDKIVPKSGRHREIIRDEFLLGLSRLVAAHRILTSTARLAQPPVASAPDAPAKSPSVIAPPMNEPAAVDPAYLTEGGVMKPWAEIAAIIRSRLGGDEIQEGASA